MKKWTGFLIVLLLLCGFALADEYDLSGVTVTVENGVVTGFRDENGAASFDGLYLDVGCDGAFVQGTVGFQRFYTMSTWDLATIVPKVRLSSVPDEIRITHADDILTIDNIFDAITISQRYHAVDGTLAVDMTIASDASYPCEIQGAAFCLRGMKAPAGTTFSFPGNTPGDVFSLDQLKPFATKQTDYCNPITMVRMGDTGLNALFLNTEEKWSTGVYPDRDGKLNIIYLPMAEGLLAAHSSMQIGTMYLQTTGDDAYAPIQSLYAALGYHTPAAAPASGPMYSCHPAGTMDSGFRDTKTMRDYASSLPSLAQMGIENIWVLPIFEHTGRGVYEPTDQRIIDKRYGTDEDVRAYVETAHENGMRVLFDYVPHGPYPEDPLAQEHPEWCSVARSGEKQIEWDCVSFDMANADYQAYTAGMVSEHVARFDVDGGRIDCAMGGLSNWHPFGDHRASSSSLRGGMEIVSAIRDGFESSGKAPVVLPENFHPVPFYASITDIFYDMPLFKQMSDLRHKNLSDAEFAMALTGWLESEHLSSVPGQLKLRFLGNHDTVSWTWDKMRATSVWGEDKAKALWTLMSTIDGVPFLYMGDEDSNLYHFPYGYDLRDFFTQLFAARKAYLSDDMDTKYLESDSAVIAFYRKNDTDTRLVLINLGKEEAIWHLDTPAVILYGNGTISYDDAVLPAYGSLLLDCP